MIHKAVKASQITEGSGPAHRHIHYSVSESLSCLYCLKEQGYIHMYQYTKC